MDRHAPSLRRVTTPSAQSPVSKLIPQSRNTKPSGTQPETKQNHDTTDTAPDRGLCDPNRLDGEEQDQEQPRGWLSRADLLAAVPASETVMDCLRGDPRHSLPDRPLPARPLRGLCEELDNESVPEMGGRKRHGIPQGRSRVARCVASDRRR